MLGTHIVRPLIILCAVLFFAAISSVRADDWPMPAEKTVCSANGSFCLKITPKKLPAQLNTSSGKKVKENFCKAEFFAAQKKEKVTSIWTVRLVNEISPARAIISDDGKYVVTFDNWAALGYGDNVVAIYRGADGGLVKKLALTDFLTEADISNLPRSTSSIWWSGVHTFDNDILLLDVVGPKNPGKDETANFKIRVKLENGEVLDEKRDYYPVRSFVSNSL